MQTNFLASPALNAQKARLKDISNESFKTIDLNI